MLRESDDLAAHRADLIDDVIKVIQHDWVQLGILHRQLHPEQIQIRFQPTQRIIGNRYLLDLLTG